MNEKFHCKRKKKQEHDCTHHLFSSIHDFEKAKQKVNVDMDFKCEICDKCFLTKNSLKTHKVRHRNKQDLPFKCEKCEFRSATKIELKRHEVAHYNDRKFMCNECGKRFTRDITLQDHMNCIHKKSETLMCGLCDYITYRQKAMHSHLKNHENMPKAVIMCPICRKTFTAKNSLKVHLLSHAEIKNFECDVCEKRFTVRSSLLSHKRAVHEPKKYKCEICQKEFSSIHNMKRHSRVHSGEKPYSCCFCSYSCNVQGNILTHIHLMHHKKTFTYKDYLKELGKLNPTTTIDSDKEEQLIRAGCELTEKVLKNLSTDCEKLINLNDLKEKVLKLRREKETSSKMIVKKKKFSTENITSRNITLTPNIVVSKKGIISTNNLENVNSKNLNLDKSTLQPECMNANYVLLTLSDDVVLVQNENFLKEIIPTSTESFLQSHCKNEGTSLNSIDESYSLSKVSLDPSYNEKSNMSSLLMDSPENSQMTCNSELNLDANESYDNSKNCLDNFDDNSAFINNVSDKDNVYLIKNKEMNDPMETHVQNNSSQNLLTLDSISTGGKTEIDFDLLFGFDPIEEIDEQNSQNVSDIFKMDNENNSLVLIVNSSED